jgi:hypothetical protein
MRLSGSALPLALAVLGIGAGCGAGARGAETPATKRSEASAKPPPRSPEGVVLEIGSPMPPPTEAARADAVLVLAEPIPDDAIRDFVFAYFDSLRRRDSDALSGLTSENGVTLEKGATYGDRNALWNVLKTPWMRNDFAKIAPAEIAVAERIERFSIADLETLDRKKPEPMRPLDALVRITMPPLRGTSEKLFEDYVWLLLRSEAGKVRIVTKFEESVQVP